MTHDFTNIGVKPTSSSIFDNSHQQFHRLRDAPLGVSLPFLLVGPFIPPMRAQNDLRRFAFLEPGFSLLGLVVTGGFRLAPDSLLAARPLAFKPPFR